MSIRQEETLGPQDARGISVKLCRADGPATRGGGWHPGRGRPLALAARPPPPFLPALARHRLGPSPLPPPARASLVRSPAPPHSPARARRSSARAFAGLNARPPGGLRRLPPARGPLPGSRLPFLARCLSPFPAPAPSARRAARGSAPPAAKMPAARPPAAGLGGIALLLALLLGSPAAARAEGKRPEGRGGGRGKVAASAGRLGVLADPDDSLHVCRDVERGRLPKFGTRNRVPLARAAGSVEAGMCLKDSGAFLPRPRAPFLPSRLCG